MLNLQQVDSAFKENRQYCSVTNKGKGLNLIQMLLAMVDQLRQRLGSNNLEQVWIRFFPLIQWLCLSSWKQLLLRSMAIIRYHFDYGSAILYYSLNEELKNKLPVSQNKMIKFVLGQEHWPEPPCQAELELVSGFTKGWSNNFAPYFRNSH